MNKIVIVGSLEQGLLFGIMALGVFISFRVLRIADLTVEGSFPLGGAIAAMMLAKGEAPLVATLAAVAGGAFAGVITGLLISRLRIVPLLSGIITMTALYSINLRVMGRPNITLLGMSTVISSFSRWLGLPGQALPFALSVAALLILALLWLFGTAWGTAMRATGENEDMVAALGVDSGGMKVWGLCLANALVALSGALVAQYQGFADVGMGVGIVVAGLAAVIIGEALLGGLTVGRALMAVMAGSICYRLIIALALRAGLAPTDLKLITAALVVLALSLPRFRSLFLQTLGR
ncbi:MAG: ABC transporter permease [Bacillota bacterium]|jgi:putative ABC transport system permease protein